jgi:acyl-CoA synthetase (AMP-forming)/AMP-acid ligase II
MLHPHGTLDLSYLAEVIVRKQVSYMTPVPTLLNSLCDSFSADNNIALHTLRSLSCGGKCSTIDTHCSSNFLFFVLLGEALTSQLVNKVKPHCSPNCHLWNLYGPAETTVVATFHKIDLIEVTSDQRSIPIGRPLPNYKCHVLDEFLQLVPIGEMGELFIGGVGVFAGYLGRDDLTSQVLFKIDGELVYKTGDLVRLDEKGLLHFIGRRDHQVKLRGQRIELSEIEHCLMQLVSNCVIIQHEKQLVAYVQAGCDIHEDRLRTHCQSHLPLHMIPSMFVITEQFPLNGNGKIDRKALPKPQQAHSSLADQRPENETEEHVHALWCSVLSRDRISTTTSFFSLGGHSLLLIGLYHLYQSIFNFLVVPILCHCFVSIFQPQIHVITRYTAVIPSSGTS